MKDQVEAALADLAYIEDSIADLTTTYREAALRYLDEHPEPALWDEDAALQRVDAAAQAGLRAIGAWH